MKKYLSVFLTVLFVLLTVCAVPGAAAAEGNPQVRLFLWDENTNSEKQVSVMYLSAGATFLIRAEADGQPVEDFPARLQTMDAALETTPVERGGKTYFRLRAADTVYENSSCTVGLDLSCMETLPDGSESYVWRCPMLGFFIFVPQKTPFAKTQDGMVYNSGETLELQENETVKLCFDLSGGAEIPSGAWSMDATQILIPGWYTQELAAAGFTVSEAPEFIGDYAYLTVSAAGMKPGAEGTLRYHFVLLRDISGDYAVGWDKAVSVYNGTLKIRVPGGTEPAFLLGDVDQNGKIEAADARLALRAAVGLETYAPDSAQFLAADADGSKAIEAADARLILRAAVGLESLS
ncbi:MAG: hypothetical protein IJT27_09620 [Clostridia bacterium]|nr:hypothetical protein [Clostridia bacterium]